MIQTFHKCKLLNLGVILLKIMTPSEEAEEATNQVVELLEEWGSQSKFIWFRELHRITDIDKGLLRNIINELKKSREI